MLCLMVAALFAGLWLLLYVWVCLYVWLLVLSLFQMFCVCGCLLLFVCFAGMTLLFVLLGFVWTFMFGVLLIVLLCCLTIWWFCIVSFYGGLFIIECLLFDVWFGFGWVSCFLRLMFVYLFSSGICFVLWFWFDKRICGWTFVSLFMFVSCCVVVNWFDSVVCLLSYLFLGCYLKWLFGWFSLVTLFW